MSGPLLRGRPPRGFVEAEALALDIAFLGEPLARARALTLLQANSSARVHASGGALVVCAALRVNTRDADGTALLRQGEFLCSVELTARDRRALREAGVGTCWVRGGVAQPLDLSRATQVDEGAWIDLSDLVIEGEVCSLGAPPPAPTDTEPEIDPDVRAALQVAPAAPEVGAVSAALAATARGSTAVAGHAIGMLAALTSLTAAGAGRYLVPVLEALRRVWGARADSRAAEDGAATARGAAITPAAPGPPGWLERLERALRSWIARSRLGAVIRRQHARYLERMLAMFDEGRLDDALRHAIPLGGEGEPGAAELGALGPRTDLSIDLGGRSGSATSLFGSVDLYALLRARYRAAFDALARSGEVEKAAFVLVELLGAHEEAVSFLERRGRLRLAAELAESKGLPPGLQVRQWFLARNVPRALSIARRTGAFADAVLRLSRDHAAAAEALRVAWAGSLADAGAYGAAVDVLWPVERCRPLATEWIERGIAIGGTTGGRMLGRKASVLPDRIAEVRDTLDVLLSQEPEAAIRVLTAFCEHLVVSEPGAPTARLARVAWRSAGRFATAGAALSDLQLRTLAQTRERLLAKASDPLLSHEAKGVAAPTPVGVTPLATRPSPLQLRWREDDRGPVVATDAFQLPDGRMLVALGELGAVLVRPDGTVQQRFAQPAVALVPSHEGDRAILLARRGEVLRLARVDLVARRCEAWCDASLSAWAPAFDGGTWYVASGSEIFGIDATAADWSRRFRVAHEQREVHVGALRCDEDDLQVSFYGPLPPPRAEGDVAMEPECELWRYSLPGQTLRRRTAVDPHQRKGLAGFTASGGVLTVEELEDGWELTNQAGAAVTLAPREYVLESSDAWVLCTREDEAGVTVTVRDLETLTARLELELAGAREARARVEGERLVLVDDVGRVLSISLATGALLADLRAPASAGLG